MSIATHTYTYSHPSPHYQVVGRWWEGLPLQVSTPCLLSSPSFLLPPSWGESRQAKQVKIKHFLFSFPFSIIYDHPYAMVVHTHACSRSFLRHNYMCLNISSHIYVLIIDNRFSFVGQVQYLGAEILFFKNKKFCRVGQFSTERISLLTGGPNFSDCPRWGNVSRGPLQAWEVPNVACPG